VRRYETVVVVRQDLSEGQVKDIFQRLENVLSANGGQILSVEDWGIRELAYKIRHEQRGHYFRLDYLAPGSLIAEIERMLRLNEAVLRYLSVLLDGNPDVEKLKQEARTKGTSEVVDTGVSQGVASGAVPPTEQQSSAEASEQGELEQG